VPRRFGQESMQRPSAAQTYVEEARLVVLELMGSLVQVYRP
jgi:hypothetical protein